MYQSQTFKSTPDPRAYLRLLYGVIMSTGVLIALVHAFIAVVRGFEVADFIRIGLDIGVVGLGYLGFELEPAPEEGEQVRRRGALVLPILGLYLVFLCAETGGLASPFFLLVLSMVVFAGLALSGHKAVLLTAVLAAAYAATAWIAPEAGFIRGDLDQVRSAVQAGRTMSTERIAGVVLRCGFLFLGMFLALRVTHGFHAKVDSLTQDATRDQLTGLPNRRGFTAKVEGELERAQRYAWPISLLIIDLDYFKRINDTYGHGFGDEVLRTSARLLKDTVGPMDHLGRIGGEEFAIAAVAAEPNHGAEVAMRILRRFREFPWGQMSKGLAVTCSIGVAVVPPDAMGSLRDKQLSEMLRAADKALYEVKSTGRDNFRVAGKPDFRASQVAPISGA